MQAGRAAGDAEGARGQKDGPPGADRRRRHGLRRGCGLQLQFPWTIPTATVRLRLVVKSSVIHASHTIPRIPRSTSGPLTQPDKPRYVCVVCRRRLRLGASPRSGLAMLGLGQPSAVRSRRSRRAMEAEAQKARRPVGAGGRAGRTHDKTSGRYTVGSCCRDNAAGTLRTLRRFNPGRPPALPPLTWPPTPWPPPPTPPLSTTAVSAGRYIPYSMR